jgi:hypothetical protein
MLDELLIIVTMPVVGLTVCPGFLLCVPAILVVAVAAPMLIARAGVRRIAQMPRAKGTRSSRRAGAQDDAQLVPARGARAAAAR